MLLFSIRTTQKQKSLNAKRKLEVKFFLATLAKVYKSILA